MLKNINHNSLHKLGIAVWQPRPFKHPETLQLDNNFIIPKQVRFNARCLVLSFKEHNDAVESSSAVSTIFNGMVGVLELSANEFMFATIIGTNPDWTQIIASIVSWQPQTILQLSTDFSIMNIGVPCVQTYSPEHLLQNKQDKSQAYKSLLNLRAILNGTS